VRVVVAVVVPVALALGACAQLAASTVVPSVTGQPETPSATAPAAVRFVALGDSYTIGTGVGREERWPDQLVERLTGAGMAIELVANLGVNGYTSRDLIEDELPQLAGLRPDFVSLLVGVNDVVQRVSTATYRANVVEILAALLEQVPRERIVVVSTPDYTRTPRGADFGNPEAQRAGIAEVNGIMREETTARGIAFVEIGSVADQAGANADLVAGDQLHPSGTQYGLWAELVTPVVTRLLAEPAE
jgi:lysophospholipase L1-like esterase